MFLTAEIMITEFLLVPQFRSAGQHADFPVGRGVVAVNSVRTERRVALP